MNRRELSASALLKISKTHARRFDGLHDYAQLVLREAKVRAELGFTFVETTIPEYGERRILKDLRDLGYKLRRGGYAGGGYRFRVSWGKDDSGD